MQRNQDSRPLDYAIIGAGCAGLYCAWRLAESGQGNILVFERTPLPGGRLLSVPMPRMPFIAELGGMRFSENQILVRELVKRLGLDKQKKSFKFKGKFFYLRGRRVALNDEEKPSKDIGEIYKLNFEEGMERGSGQLIAAALKEVLLDSRFDGVPEKLKKEVEDLKENVMRSINEGKKFDNEIMTLRQWRLWQQYGRLSDQNVPLWKIGFWNLLWSYLKQSERYFYAHDALGYQSIVTNWNAAEAVPWYLKDFGAAGYESLDRMDALPYGLEAKFKEMRPNSIHYKHLLKRINRFSRGGESYFELVFEPTVKELKNFQSRVLAKHLILALPQGALKRIEGIEELISRAEVKEFRKAVDSVISHPLFKLFMAFDQVWWDCNDGIGCSFGKVITDLPIRQVYYFGPEKTVKTKDFPDGKTTRGMLMASYSDARYVDFWKPFQDRTGEDWEPHWEAKDGALNPVTEAPLLKSYGAPTRLVNKAIKQIEELHPGLRSNNESKIPRPYTALMMDWSEEPYYGGWHTWKVNIQPWKRREYLAKPFNNLELYICGEAYSSEQGWIEGALKSAEMVLKKLGVSPPTWLGKEQNIYDDYIDSLDV